MCENTYIHCVPSYSWQSQFQKAPHELDREHKDQRQGLLSLLTQSLILEKGRWF